MVLSLWLVGQSILALCLAGAPVPRYRPGPAPIIEPGRYECNWSGTKCVYEFNENHSMSVMWYKSLFVGEWHYDKAKRVLHFRETSDFIRYEVGEILFHPDSLDSAFVTYAGSSSPIIKFKRIK